MLDSMLTRASSSSNCLDDSRPSQTPDKEDPAASLVSSPIRAIRAGFVRSLLGWDDSLYLRRLIHTGVPVTGPGLLDNHAIAATATESLGVIHFLRPRWRHDERARSGRPRYVAILMHATP